LKGRNLVARRILALPVVLVAIVGFAACGGASQQELAAAEKHARQEKAEKEKEARLQREVEKLKKERQTEKKLDRKRAAVGAVPAPAPSETSSTPSSERTSCGGSLSVGPDTTCAFAENVEAEYYAEIGSGEGYVFAYSEANEEWYEMFCTGAPHECSGAISAKVYFP
jgi:hypothetical protein